MAAMTVRELLTKWGFQADTKPIEKLNKSLSDVKTTVALIGAQAIAQVGAVFGLTNSVAKLGDEAAKNAARIGINVEALQEYAHVADLAGSNSQQMTSSLESLTLGISEARKGGGKLIEPLIRINQLTGKDLLTNMGNAEDMMLGLADAFAGITDETERAELSSKIFGGSGLAMVNVLKQGSAAIREQRQEARDLGIVLSAKTARQSEDFIDSLTRVKGALNGLKNIVGGELLPIVTGYMKQIKDWILLNRQWLKENLLKMLYSMIEGFKKLILFLKSAYKVVDGFVISMGGLERVLKFVMAAMVLFTAVKFLSAIGNLTMAIGGGLVAAFRMAGNQALLAQAKMAAIPIAIGLAIAGLFLIIEDLYAWFQGRDSLFGLLVKDGDQIGGKFGKIISDLITTVKDMMKGAMISVFDFFTSDNPEDAQKRKEIVDGLLSLLNLAFMASTIPLRIGMAIADGIIEGMTILIAKKFPTLAGLMGIKTQEQIKAQEDEMAKINAKFGTDFKREDKGFLGGTFDSLVNTVSGLTSYMMSDKPAASGMSFEGLALAGAGGGGGSMNITNNNSINVPVTIPPGTNPAEGQRMVANGVQEAFERMVRETQAATNSNVER